MPSEGLKDHEITETIIGCSMKVPSYFGPGFPEIIYQRALRIELEKELLVCFCEVERDIIYEDRLIGKRKLDLIVEDKKLVELKAVTELDNGCDAQVINYLRIFDIEVGLFINFSADSLKFRRFVNSKKSVKPI